MIRRQSVMPLAQPVAFAARFRQLARLLRRAFLFSRELLLHLAQRPVGLLPRLFEPLEASAEIGHTPFGGRCTFLGADYFRVAVGAPVDARLRLRLARKPPRGDDADDAARRRGDDQDRNFGLGEQENGDPGAGSPLLQRRVSHHETPHGVPSNLTQAFLL
ncbi:MAG: hypothetical protein U1F23_08610 [Lysobacterales bacterium]